MVQAILLQKEAMAERKTRRRGTKAFLPTSSTKTTDVKAAVLDLPVPVKLLQMTPQETQISQAVTSHLNHPS